MPAKVLKVIFNSPKIPGSRLEYGNETSRARPDNVRVDYDRRVVVIPGEDGHDYVYPFESGVKAIVEETAKPEAKK